MSQRNIVQLNPFYSIKYFNWFNSDKQIWLLHFISFVDFRDFQL